MDYQNMRSSEPTPLARLQSIYSLTLDEFQDMIGRMGLANDFRLMNMDELLKNIWMAEDHRAMVSSSPSASGGLQRQGSLTLPWTISQKMVDEVWRDISGQQEFQQPSLGEMMLAEFLVRAGVVREDVINQPPVMPVPIFANTITTPVPNNNNGMFYNDLPLPLPSSSRKPGISLTFGQPGPSQESLIPNSGMTRAYAAAELVSPKRMRGGGLVGLGMGDPAMSGGLVGLGMGDPAMSNGLMPGMVGIWGGEGMSASALALPANQITSDGLARSNRDLSSLFPEALLNGAQRGRKIGAEEKAVEMRQNRMIRHRESAARSRAKKQAYAMELEAKIAILREKNEELRKKQALERITHQHVPKKRSLRRTQTCFW